MEKMDWSEMFFTFLSFSFGIMGIFGILTALSNPEMQNRLSLFIFSALLVGASFALLKELFDV